MMIAKVDFLWYKRKDVIKESDSQLIEDWKSNNFIEEMNEIIESKSEVKSPPILKEIKEEPKKQVKKAKK
jgi:hypothetical protein